MKVVGMLVVSLRGVNFGFWSRLGLHAKKYIFDIVYLLHSYNPSFLIRLCFNMASFRDQKKLGPRPDRSPLGV